MRRHKRLHPSVLALACFLPACDPAAKNLGEDVEADAAADEWTVDWRVDSAIDSIFFDIEPTSDGGVLVVEGNSTEHYHLVRRYAVDGATLWTLDPHTVSGGSLATAGSAIFLAGARHVPGAVGERVSLQRLSGAGVVEREYVRARDGDSNSFSFDVAASSGEVAVVIGNWGKPAYEGEPFFEVQRLDHELEPIADPIAFDSAIQQIAYDASGDLVVLEISDDNVARVHRPLSGAEPAVVDCLTLLTSSGAPLCANAQSQFRLTNYETGEVQELDTLDVEGFGRSARTSSTVFAASPGGDWLLHIAEVLDDGGKGRSVRIPLSESGVDGHPVAIQQHPTGAVYAIVTEVFEGGPCSESNVGNCIQSHLFRLAAD